MKGKIEAKLGCSMDSMKKSMESCIRVAKSAQNGDHYFVTITDWDAEHLLMLLNILDEMV